MNRIHSCLLTSIALTGVLGACLNSAPSLQAKEATAGSAELFSRLDANGDGVVAAKEVSAENKRLFERLVRRADRNRDGALTEQEFLAGLVPSRPEKKIEEKQPSSFPQADAVRWLLLSLDTSGNRQIEASEVPDSLRDVFESLLEPIDRNGNDRLDAVELNRGGQRLAQIAGRYVAREQIDVAAELKKMEKEQGDAVKRFDEQPDAREMLRDPAKARQFFSQLDDNGDGVLKADEVPDPLRPQIERFLQFGDRDRDGSLSETEFLNAAERASRFMRQADREMKRPDAKSDRKKRPNS